MKTTEMQFLEAQLKLFVRLCLGDNQNVMNSFWTKPVQSEHTMSFGVQITFQHIMRVLDARIHPRIKTIYVELLQGDYIWQCACVYTIFARDNLLYSSSHFSNVCGCWKEQTFSRSTSIFFCKIILAKDY